MIKKNLSIVDIADKLGISKTTVSFILNNRAKEKRISEELVDKVLKFIKEVGYKPNALAKSLRTGKSYIIGLMVENIADPFFANIARYIEERAYKNGYRIIYCSTDNDIDKTKDMITMFRERHVDGYIIAPPLGVENDIVELMNDGFPVVLFDRFLQGVDSSYVVTDNMFGTYNATLNLIAQGHQNIAFVTFKSEQTQMQARLAGYKKALEENNLKSNVREVDFNPDTRHIIKPITEFLEANKDFDAILFGTNRIGTCGLKVINNLSIRVPDDMAVISFDDSEVFELYSPSITAIAQPVEEIAGNVMDILLCDLNTPAARRSNRQVVLKTKLNERASSAIESSLAG